MIQYQHDGLIFYQFPSLLLFAPLKHAFFTRHGGKSSYPFNSLNVAYDVGDDDKAVDENLLRIKKMFHATVVVWVKQNHGSDVAIINDEFLATYMDNDARNADALVTSKKGVALLIKVADCQAIFLYDTVKNAIANIHCGWRGNVNGIISHTISVMKNFYGSVPRDIIATVCPSLGPCCAEFKGYRDLLPDRFQHYREKTGFFDFWDISRDQLLENGVLPENIEISNLCTVCNSDIFFSYRKEKITGRGAAVIMLSNS